MLRVAFDLDGVAADFTKGFTQVAQHLGIVDHCWSACCQPTWDFDFDVAPVWKELKARQNWWCGLEPLLTKTDVGSINVLIRDFNVCFITTRVETAGMPVQRQSEFWLKGLGIDTDRAPVYVAPHGGKGKLCQALGIQTMLDDNVTNLLDLRDHGVDAFCRPWQYNANWAGPKATVPEFIRHLYHNTGKQAVDGDK